VPLRGDEGRKPADCRIAPGAGTAQIAVLHHICPRWSSSVAGGNGEVLR
jgi:hypothetical protein